MVQTGFFENGLQGLCSTGMALTLTTLCILSDPWEPGVRGEEGRGGAALVDGGDVNPKPHLLLLCCNPGVPPERDPISSFITLLRKGL
jgi:hypothetical protein